MEQEVDDTTIRRLLHRRRAQDQRLMMLAKCEVDGCGREGKFTRGPCRMCRMHDRRWVRHGDTEINLNDKTRKFIQEIALPYRESACLIWPFSYNERGRPQLHVNGRVQKAARYICSLAHGEPPTPKHVTAHGRKGGKIPCEDGCVAPLHVRWATQKQNGEDTVKQGRSTRGTRHGTAKLTEKEVLEIRRLATSGLKLKDIATRFDVVPQYVGAIVMRKTWSWLEPGKMNV